MPGFSEYYERNEGGVPEDYNWRRQQMLSNQPMRGQAPQYVPDNMVPRGGDNSQAPQGFNPGQYQGVSQGQVPQGSMAVPDNMVPQQQASDHELMYSKPRPAPGYETMGQDGKWSQGKTNYPKIDPYKNPVSAPEKIPDDIPAKVQQKYKPVNPTKTQATDRESGVIRPPRSSRATPSIPNKQLPPDPEGNLMDNIVMPTTEYKLPSNYGSGSLESLANKPPKPIDFSKGFGVGKNPLKKVPGFEL